MTSIVILFQAYLWANEEIGLYLEDEEVWHFK